MILKAIHVGIFALHMAASMFFLVTCTEDQADSQDIERGKVRSQGKKKSARDRQKKKTGLLETDLATKAKREQSMSLPQLKETDFIKGAKRRDPFEPFKELLIKRSEERKIVQREVKLKDYDISALKLIGIITNIGDPRAMVVVPDGTGYVLKRGDYVGRADYIQQGGSDESIQVNWRVARIHGSGKEEERGIYFVRDDPTTTKGVDITRFLPLHARE